jgi:hypothetical protein
LVAICTAGRGPVQLLTHRSSRRTPAVAAADRWPHPSFPTFVVPDLDSTAAHLRLGYASRGVDRTPRPPRAYKGRCVTPESFPPEP